ncbi:MAG: hypothetical protein AAGA32_17425 [Pseudomonadota bacterium]
MIPLRRGQGEDHRQAIPAVGLVEAVCIAQVSLSQVLLSYRWRANARAQKRATEALIAALQGIQRAWGLACADGEVHEMQLQSTCGLTP